MLRARGLGHINIDRYVALKKMLRAFGQPVQHMWQHHATIMQDVALKCCESLARPLMLMSLSSLVTTSKFEKNICFKMRPVGPININTKQCKKWTPFMKVVYSPVYTTDNFRHGSCEIGTGA